MYLKVGYPGYPFVNITVTSATKRLHAGDFQLSKTAQVFPIY